MSDEPVKKWSFKIVDFDRYLRPTDSLPSCFPVQSCSLGVAAEPPYAGNPRRANLFDINLIRQSDAATPVFMRLCAAGEVLHSVLLELVAEKDGTEVFRMNLELVNATINSVYPNGSDMAPGLGLTESLSFQYEKLRVMATEREKKGGADLTPQRP